MKSITFFFLAAAPLAADIEIYPTLHFNGVLSETSADSFDDIGGHGHDPNDEYAIQGIDVGLNVKIDDWFASFINVKKSAVVNSLTVSASKTTATFTRGNL